MVRVNPLSRAGHPGGAVVTLKGWISSLALAALAVGLSASVQADSNSNALAAINPQPPAQVTDASVTATDWQTITLSWGKDSGADYYRLMMKKQGQTNFQVLDASLKRTSRIIDLPDDLSSWQHVQYQVTACNKVGCTPGTLVSADTAIRAAKNYLKASNPAPYDEFGIASAISADGKTLAISGGDAVYVYMADGHGSWVQKAYLKAANAQTGDDFGASLSISADGRLLAVGATGEKSDVTGINSSRTNNRAPFAGAVYLFAKNAKGAWGQVAYVKASNTGAGDEFGSAVALSADGKTLAVGAFGESSKATGINGDQSDNSDRDAGATYVFVSPNREDWQQQAYIKASNTAPMQQFGWATALSNDGNVLAVSAPLVAPKKGKGQDGAAYVFDRDDSGQWRQVAMVQADNGSTDAYFGQALALDGTGNRLAVGAIGDSVKKDNAGAVFLFDRTTAGTWEKQQVLRPKIVTAYDAFGNALSFDHNGRRLVVGSTGDSSKAIDVNGNARDHSVLDAGAAYIFDDGGQGQWQQVAYLKSPNPHFRANFGWSVALSGDGHTLAAGAIGEAGAIVEPTADSQKKGSHYSAPPETGAAHVFYLGPQGRWQP